MIMLVDNDVQVRSEPTSRRTQKELDTLVQFVRLCNLLQADSTRSEQIPMTLATANKAQQQQRQRQVNPTGFEVSESCRRTSSCFWKLFQLPLRRISLVSITWARTQYCELAQVNSESYHHKLAAIQSAGQSLLAIESESNRTRKSFIFSLLASFIVRSISLQQQVDSLGGSIIRTNFGISIFELIGINRRKQKSHNHQQLAHFLLNIHKISHPFKASGRQ